MTGLFTFVFFFSFSCVHKKEDLFAERINTHIPTHTHAHSHTLSLGAVAKNCCTNTLGVGAIP